MISKTVIIIISVVIFVGILALIIYFKNKKKNGSSTQDKKCNGDICGKNCCENGLKCQSDGETCCKDELWGTTESNLRTCCGSALCGSVCCDKGHNCGVDKNGNKVCCKGKTCGENNLCCSATGDECQIDAQGNTVCCKKGYWDDTQKKCCDRPVCNGTCCDAKKQCDGNKCIDCETDLCGGTTCCQGEETCQHGKTKDICCKGTNNVCGDTCCQDGETCLQDGTCCASPCGQITGPDGKPVFTSCCEGDAKFCVSANNKSKCCSTDNQCTDIVTGDPTCFADDVCGYNAKGNCVCCKSNQKFVNGKCVDHCASEFCNPNQYCLEVNNVKKGCVTKGCEWGNFNYDPDVKSSVGVIFADFPSTIIDACSYNNRDYVVRDPIDPDNPNQVIPRSDLKRIGTRKQVSQIPCTLNDCKLSQQKDTEYLNFDDNNKTCTLNFDCSDLESLDELKQNGCPALEGSCCRDNSGEYTGQVCPSDRKCYQNSCICNTQSGETPAVNNCVYFDRHNTCNDQGTPDFNSTDFSCICDPIKEGDPKSNYAGNKCQYSREKTCNDHGNPKNDGTCTGQCDAGFFGQYCQFNNAITCHNGGVVIDDKGTCKCSDLFYGKSCQYNRSETCSNRGIPDDNGICFCDPSFKGANCSSVINNGNINWVYIAKNPEAGQPVKQHVGVLTAPGYSGTNQGFIKFSPGSFLYSISNQIFFIMDSHGNMVMQEWGNDDDPPNNDGLRELSTFYVNRNTSVYTDPNGNIMKAI